MDEGKNELEDLTREIQQLIKDNRKFLDRIIDDDFEPEEEEGEEEAGVIEEL